MALITVRQFIEITFKEGSRPSPRTIIRQIQIGEIPGQQMGPRGFWYVDIDAYREMHNLSPLNKEEKITEVH